MKRLGLMQAPLFPYQLLILTYDPAHLRRQDNFCLPTVARWGLFRIERNSAIHASAATMSLDGSRACACQSVSGSFNFIVRPELIFVFYRWIDHARNVAGGRQHEGDIAAEIRQAAYRRISQARYGPLLLASE